MASGSRLTATPATDPALWQPVTVLSAWSLAMARVRVRPELLADVREHVLRCLPETVRVADLTEAVPPLVTDYIKRVRKGRYVRAEPTPAAPEWTLTDEEAQGIFADLDPLAEAVVRLHYGDRLSLRAVADHIRVDEARLRTCREGLREHLSVHLGFEEPPGEGGWTDRLDARWRLLADRPKPGCPGPLGLTTDAGLRHADRCAPCGRAARLIRGGVLQPRDLFRPPGAMVDSAQVEVLALLVHPDGRRHHGALEAALGPTVRPAGPDAWLVPGEAIPTVLKALHALAEQGTPARHHLRGAVLEGPGRWSRGVLLGPLGVAAIEAARARPWADLGGLAELPVPLPPPPSAAGWWGGAALAAAAALAVGVVTMLPETNRPATPVEAAFSPTAGGWHVRFDTEDLATVDVVTLRDDALTIALRDIRSGKGAWATGAGDYALSVHGDDIAVISSPSGLDALESWVLHASRQPDPVRWLRDHIQAVAPEADVAVSPERVASLAGSAAYTAQD